MFMVRVYNEDGNRMWLDNGFVWDNIETLKNRIHEEIDNDKKILGASKKTYTVIPISFYKSRMIVDNPMTDKEVEISDVDFDDNAKGFEVKGDKSISSFLYAWVEKNAMDKNYSRDSIEQSVLDGNMLTITVKEHTAIGA